MAERVRERNRSSGEKDQEGVAWRERGMVGQILAQGTNVWRGGEIDRGHGGATRHSLYPIQCRLNSTGQFYGVGLEIRRSFEASRPRTEPSSSPPRPGDRLSPSASSPTSGRRHVRITCVAESTAACVVSRGYNRESISRANCGGRVRATAPSFHVGRRAKVRRGFPLIYALVDLLWGRVRLK